MYYCYNYDKNISFNDRWISHSFGCWLIQYATNVPTTVYLVRFSERWGKGVALGSRASPKYCWLPRHFSSLAKKIKSPYARYYRNSLSSLGRLHDICRVHSHLVVREHRKFGGTKSFRKSPSSFLGAVRFVLQVFRAVWQLC